MNDVQPMSAEFPAQRGWVRRTGVLAALGLVSVLSLLMRPIPSALLEANAALSSLPPPVLSALMMLNPLILVLIGTALGAALAHRVGLKSILAGTAPASGIARPLFHAVAIGFVLGGAIVLADGVLAPALGDTWQQLRQQTPAPSGSSLAIGVLYGGIAEEIMMRWGLMSLFVWLLIKGIPNGGRIFVYWSAITLAALAFGAAHLPALAAELVPTPAIILRTLLLNGIAGMLYGWLFWRYHLEASMAAHAATHLGMAAALMV